MPEKLWKKVQREHHKRMGGQGRTSYRYEDGPDSVPLPWLVVESKSVAELPKWLTEAVETIVGQATNWIQDKLRHLNPKVEKTTGMYYVPDDEGSWEYQDLPERLGIVRYHVTGTKYDDDLIVLRAKDFESWFL